MINTLQVGPRTSLDGIDGPQRGDNYGNLCVQRNGAMHLEMTRRGRVFTYSQSADGVNLFTPTATSVITTGAFVTGRRYQIANVGDTDFTLIGAAANTVGVEFVATGAGGGTTGTANLMNSTPMIWNKIDSGVNFIPIRITMGIQGAVAMVLGPMGLYALSSPGSSITVPTADIGTAVNNFIGGPGQKSSVLFSPTGQLLTTAPTFIKTLPWNLLANDLAGKNMTVLEYNFNGRTIVRPDCAVFVGPLAEDAAVAIISIEGYEIPIQKGAA